MCAYFVVGLCTTVNINHVFTIHSFLSLGFLKSEPKREKIAKRREEKEKCQEEETELAKEWKIRGEERECITREER